MKSLLKQLVRIATLALFCFLGSLAMAVEPNEILADPVKEARARELSKGLRCVVCRNQSIDDSNAEIARDLRVLLRDRLVLGYTDEEALLYLVNRYGPYILLKPPLNLSTYLLWFGPVFLIFLASFGFWQWWLKSSMQAPEGENLSVEDRALLTRILAAKETP